LNAALIFDADDTLWDTQPLYSEAKRRFFLEMAEAGFPLEGVRQRLEVIDHANVSRFGFSKERFPQSMWDTYHSLCNYYGRRFDDTKARRIQSIGAAVFEAQPRIFDGVSASLSELQAHHVRLILATKGDREVQQQRLDASHLRHYFDRVYILPDKGTREFRAIVMEEKLELSAGWSVGNSARSDINPALAVGLRAIWIPNKTWMYEDEEPAASPRLYRVESIREVPGIVLRET
jgi:putative hydrolase of the HAD superfamily